MLLAQFLFSVSVLTFTGIMMVTDVKNINTYLPIFTSMAFAWLPSPLSPSSVTGKGAPRPNSKNIPDYMSDDTEDEQPEATPLLPRRRPTTPALRVPHTSVAPAPTQMV